MIEERVCYVKDIPIGSIIQEDTYSDKDVLLIRKQSIISDRLLEQLSAYKGKIRVKIDVPESAKNLEKDRSEDSDKQSNIVTDELKDNSITFDSSFKEQVLDSISSIYDNLEEPEEIVDGSTKLINEIYSVISSSKSLEVNLSNLKVSDEYTYKHSVDVGTISSIMAAALDKPEWFIKNVGIAGLLHDIGKTKIPISIINKPSKLTKEEFAIIMQHPVYGYQMLMDCDLDLSIKYGVLNHHENVDGSGYPRRLSKKEIDEIGKILSIVDVFDALVTKRPYKDGKTVSEAIEIMFTMSNKFDLNYFHTFLSVINAYPNGTNVKLSNGETCVVVKQNRCFPMRPVVCNKQGVIIDLAKDVSYLSAIIVKSW